MIAGAILVAAYGALCTNKFNRAGNKAAEEIKKEAGKTVQSLLKEEKLKARVAKAKADLQPLLVACIAYDNKYETQTRTIITQALRKLKSFNSEEQIDKAIQKVVDTITKQLGDLETTATTGVVWTTVDETFTELEAAYNTLKRTRLENDSDDAVGHFGEPIQSTVLS